MQRTRLLGLLIDGAIILVLATHTLAFVTLRQEQRRYDGDARAIATWMKQQNETRLAWPKDLRATVPALLDAGVTPVLYEGLQPVIQDLAVEVTPIVVVRDNTGLRVSSRRTLQQGSLTAALVDLRPARATPLAVGETLGQEIARPYVYSPIRKSLQVSSDTPFEVRLNLDAGRYSLAVDAFDPNGEAYLYLSATDDLGRRTRDAMRLGRVADIPAYLSFVVSAKGPRRVIIKFGSFGEGFGPADALVHSWNVQRVT